MAVKKVWTEARAKVDGEGKCRACGRRPFDGKSPRVFKLEAAHTVGQKYQDEIRIEVEGGPKIKVVKAVSVVPLCLAEDGGCHEAYDSGRLDLLPHLTTEEQLDAVAAVGMHRAYERTTGTRKAAV